MSKGVLLRGFPEGAAAGNGGGGTVSITPQEAVVLRRLAEGETAPEVACSLGVSVTTVRTHLRSLREKLGVKTQAGLVAEGFRRALIDPRDGRQASRQTAERADIGAGSGTMPEARGAGCGCKIGKDVLGQVLSALPRPPSDRRIMVGTESLDDACAFCVADDLAVVGSVDFFTPVVPDPETFGAIAAVNALSDLFAMGAEPIFALALCAYPKDGDLGALTRIARGGAIAAAREGCPVLGGHTIDDPEPKYGLAVVGTAHPERLLTNTAGRAGDHLVLTKPVGVGIVSTAFRAGAAGEDVLQEAVETMMRSNRTASACALEAGVRCATDVTGYGLVGHLGEIAGGSGLEAHIRMGAVPLVAGARDLAAAGHVSGGLRRNRSFAGGFARFSPDLPGDLELVACDPQTSGGLLLAVPDDPSELLRALRSRGVVGAVIGRLTAGASGRVMVGA